MTTIVSEQEMEVVFERPKFYVEEGHHWCPGCGYGLLPRIFNEEFSKIPVSTGIIGVVDIGCISQLPPMLDIEMTGSAHGRAIAVATGIKRVRPDVLVCVFIGDGGVLMEGLNEVLHASAKAENITIFMFNNGVLADTGGQLTMSGSVGLVTSTTPEGRSVERNGHPIKIAEILSTMPGAAYVARLSTHDPVHAHRAQAVIADAIQCQLNGGGLAFVDMLTTCPTSWGMTPIEANKFQAEVVIPQNPVGVLKAFDKTGGIEGGSR